MLSSAPLWVVLVGMLPVIARSPDVTWDRKNNPHPWLHIDQQTQLKLMTVQEGQDFTKTYSRDRL
ncbi:MAG: hypothetical protein J3Q66DRAFT_331073 [Benniella sp.]|nr:MAG: hypothetical protein J3Q66DRAFT_331073 [Benniella sp.]